MAPKAKAAPKVVEDSAVPKVGLLAVRSASSELAENLVYLEEAKKNVGELTDTLINAAKGALLGAIDDIITYANMCLSDHAEKLFNMGTGPGAILLMKSLAMESSLVKDGSLHLVMVYDLINDDTNNYLSVIDLLHYSSKWLSRDDCKNALFIVVKGVEE